jgi:hypothetical protein
MRRTPLRVPGALVGLAVLAVLAALAALSGCAASSAAAAPPDDPAARGCLAVTGGAPWHGMARVDGDRVTLDAYDDYFSPSCLLVPAGHAVTLVVTNRGHVPHVIGGPDPSFGGSVDAGQTAFVPLPPVSGRTRLVCGLHAEEHMVLAVVPTGAGSDV